MLPNHQPLVVAEQFGTLDALHPGRIDLGVGRAPGTDPRTARALRRGADPHRPSSPGADDFPEQLAELSSCFRGEGPVTAVPAQGQRPELWLLGSSGYSAQLAGLLGLPFTFAHHFSAENTLPALALYRDTFRPSAALREPHAMIAASVLAADTDAEAQRLALPGALHTDAAVALFSADVSFHSPVVQKSYEGREALRVILSTVVEVFEDFRCTGSYVGDGGHVLVFAGRIGDREPEGVDILRGADGVITELTVMVRPYSAAPPCGTGWRRCSRDPDRSRDHTSSTCSPRRPRSTRRRARAGSSVARAIQRRTCSR